MGRPACCHGSASYMLLDGTRAVWAGPNRIRPLSTLVTRQVVCVAGQAPAQVRKVRKNVSEAPRATRLSPRVIGISVAAAIGGFLFGFDTSVINGAVDALSADFSLGGWLQGFAVSSALLGCAVGAWFAGPMANKLGRVPTMVISSVLFLVSAVGSGLAFG